MAEAAVVVTVAVAVPPITTGVLEIEQPGKSTPIVGEVRVQVSVTVLAYPATAVTVTVELALAPGAIVAGEVAAKVKEDCVTVTVATPGAG